MANIKKIYLYAICLVTMAISIFAGIRLLNIALDLLFENTYSNWNEQLPFPVAALVICLPIFLIHWHMARKES
jgi:hypothetical protein